MSLFNVTNLLNGFALSQAMWGAHLLMPAGSKLGVLSSGIWDGYLRLTSELDAEQIETTEAQNPLDVKGGDKPKEFSIQLQVSKLGTGSDPLVVAQAWQRSLGQSHLFFVGALPISSSQFILKHVDMFFAYEDTAADGSPLRCDIGLEFVEDVVLAVASRTQKEEKPSEGASSAAKKASPKAQGESFDASKLLSETQKSYGL